MQDITAPQAEVANMPRIGDPAPAFTAVTTQGEITFPLIDDVSMNLARKYGMIMPGEASTRAVRAVFVIDPSGMVRTVLIPEEQVEDAIRAS